MLLTFAFGCAVDQQKEVERYRAVLREGVHDQRSADALAPGQPLTLRDALLLANERNENLGVSGEDYVQALIDKDRAAAAFLPTISLAPTYFIQDPARPTGTGNPPRNKQLDVPVTGSANLFNGFRDVANLRRAADTIEQRRELLLDLQQQLLLDVAGAYYRVLSAERSVQVLENSIRVQDERVRDIRGRHAAGLARPLDVAQIEAQAAATRVSLLQARRDVENGRSFLEFLVAAPVRQSRLVDEYPLDRVPGALEEVLKFAEENRRDLLAARAASLAARQNVEVAVGQYYPSIALDVNYFLSRNSTPTDSEWNALFSANLPIFSAGLIEADVRTAWSQYRQAKLDESRTSRSIENDVRGAHENLTSSDKQIAELRVQRAAAADAFRQAEESYKVGLATNLERVAAQDALLSAELQLATEQYNRKVLYLTLLRASGRSLFDDAPSIAVSRPSTGPATAPSTRPE